MATSSTLLSYYEDDDDNDNRQLNKPRSKKNKQVMKFKNYRKEWKTSDKDNKRRSNNRKEKQPEL